MKTSHAHIGDAHDAVSHYFGSRRGFFRNRQITGAGANHSDAAGPLGQRLGINGNTAGEIVKDYAIVSRLLDSKTGQVLIAAAGIGANGTQAAGEFISNRDELERAFKNAPPDWPKKNVQVLLETTVTDSVAGPPRLVASVSW